QWREPQAAAMPVRDQQEEPVEDEIDERRAKMERLRAEGIDPYPPVSLWKTRTRIADVLAAHDPSQLDHGEHPELRHHVAGRVISRRGHGKTSFLDLRDLSGQVPPVVRAGALGQERFARVINVDIGEIVGVEGVVYVPQRGHGKTSFLDLRD